MAGASSLGANCDSASDSGAAKAAADLAFVTHRVAIANDALPGQKPGIE